MPGLDDTYRELERFRRALSDFDGQLRSSVVDLGKLEDKMSGLWDDQFRRDFESRRVDVSEPVKRYIARDGERYLEFLDRRIKPLRRYFGHG